MEKIDLRKELKSLYSPRPNRVETVEIPRLQFVMIDGIVPAGESPGNSLEYQEAVQALYGAAYTLKFMAKQRKENPLDFTVMALEGLWWIIDGEFDFHRRVDWYFTMMVLQPAQISEEMFNAGLTQLRKKKGSPAISKLRLASFEEGFSIQVMHVGPYAEEPRTVELMKAFAHEHGYERRGKHHEIYLGDPRRTKPEKLKTILRQPVEPAARSL